MLHQLAIPTSHCLAYALRSGQSSGEDIVALSFEHIPPGGTGTTFSCKVSLTAADARSLATLLADLADEIDARRQLPPNATLVEANHANR